MKRPLYKIIGIVILDVFHTIAILLNPLLRFIPTIWTTHLYKKARNTLNEYVLNPDYPMLEIIQKNSTAYKIRKPMGNEPLGIVLHTVTADKPLLNRFIRAPYELGPIEEEDTVLDDLKIYHGYIGYDNGNKIVYAKTFPYTMSCFFCGKGKKGSFDTAPFGRIQIAIVKDIDNDPEYFKKVMFDVAVQICAYICKTEKLEAASILSDKEVCDKGYGAKFSGLDEWLCENGKSMKNFRRAVKNRLIGL